MRNPNDNDTIVRMDKFLGFRGKTVVLIEKDSSKTANKHKNDFIIFAHNQNDTKTHIKFYFFTHN